LFGEIEQVAGQIAQRDIRQWTPIQMGMLGTQSNNVIGVIPDGYVTVMIPVERFTSDTSALYLGSVARVYAVLRISDDLDYPPALLSYARYDEDVVQITVTRDAQVISLDAESIQLAVPPLAKQIILWLVENKMNISTDANVDDANANRVPYYLPPEGFEGNYDELGSGGDVIVRILIPADADGSVLATLPIRWLADDGTGVLTFEAFANIGTYTRRDEEGNIIETGKSARLLVDFIYADMLEVLRTNNINYTYTLTLANNFIAQLPAPQTAEVKLTLPPDTPYLTNLREGDTIELILVTQYSNSDSERQLFVQAGLTPPDEPSNPALFFDKLVIERIDTPPSRGPIDVILAKQGDIELLQWAIENGRVELLMRPQDN
jgi:hypothetical protein